MMRETARRYGDRAVLMRPDRDLGHPAWFGDVGGNAVVGLIATVITVEFLIRNCHLRLRQHFCTASLWCVLRLVVVWVVASFRTADRSSCPVCRSYDIASGVWCMSGGCFQLESQASYLCQETVKSLSPGEP